MCLHCIDSLPIKITPRMSHFSYLTFNVIYWIIVYAVFKVHVRLNFIQSFRNLKYFRFMNHWINQLYKQQYPVVKVSTLLLGCLFYLNFSSRSKSYLISNPRFQPAFRIKSALLSAPLYEVIFLDVRQPPAFPHRLQCSIIGRLRLNRRVRDGNGCFP